MTTPRIEEAVEELLTIHCDIAQTAKGDMQFKEILRKALTEARQSGIDGAVEIINNTKTREMSVGENRSKYLSFNRGENHMKVKLLTKLQDNK